MSDIEDLIRQEAHPDDEPVTIERGRLEDLLFLARLGDVANSQRRLRNGFRHVAGCSNPRHRDPDCYLCQTFATAEEALAVP